MGVYSSFTYIGLMLAYRGERLGNAASLAHDHHPRPFCIDELSQTPKHVFAVVHREDSDRRRRLGHRLFFWHARSDQYRLATVRTIRTASTRRMRRADRFRWLEKTWAARTDVPGGAGAGISGASWRRMRSYLRGLLKRRICSSPRSFAYMNRSSRLCTPSLL